MVSGKKPMRRQILPRRTDTTEKRTSDTTRLVLRRIKMQPRAKFVPFFFSFFFLSFNTRTHLTSKKMAVVIWLLAAVLLFVILKEVWKWYVDINQPGLPPGDKGLPFFYSFFDIFSNKVRKKRKNGFEEILSDFFLSFFIFSIDQHRIYDYALEYFLRHGSRVTTTRLLGLVPRVIRIADPRCVEHVLKDNWQNYEKGKHLTDILLPLLGDGIFNVNGREPTTLF